MHSEKNFYHKCLTGFYIRFWTHFLNSYTSCCDALNTKGAPHTLNHTISIPPSPKQVQEVHEPGLFQSGYSQSNQHKRYFQITTSKISYNLIEPQLFHCTPTCCYKFHAIPVHLHPTFTASPIGDAFGILSSICGGSFFRENSQFVEVAGRNLNAGF